MSDEHVAEERWAAASLMLICAVRDSPAAPVWEPRGCDWEEVNLLPESCGQLLRDPLDDVRL